MLTRLSAASGRRRDDQRGSIILAVGVIMVLSMLSIAVLSRSLANVVSVRRTQDFTAALSGADSGLADALYQIDQKQTATFSRSGTTGATSWSYTATYVDRNTWTVASQGTTNKVKHAISAKVTRKATYPYAIFTQQDLTFNGNGGANITSYNSITDPGKTINTHDAFVGSNHAIVISSGGGGGDGQDFYTPNGSCSGCSNGQQVNGPRPMTDPPVPSPSQACPANGIFTGTIDGGAGLGYLCNRDVTFSGTVTVVNPPLIVYVGANYNVEMANANVNAGFGAEGKDFLLLKAGTGALDVGTGSNAATIIGVIYAPNTNITIDGGQVPITGSLTVNQVTTNGNPNFVMQYDDSISQITNGDWKVSNWHEVPTS